MYFRMKTRLLLIVGFGAMALFAGCDSIPPGVERGPHRTMAYYVTVETSPPGARIEANGQVIGNAPLHLKIFGDPDGTFHDFGSYYYIVRALPVATNQFVQTRVFRTGHLFTPEDQVPQRIDFDMNQPNPYPYAGAGYVYPAYPPAAYYGPPVYYGPPAYYGPGVQFYVGPRYYRHW
jgi:hypothetical protein